MNFYAWPQRLGSALRRGIISLAVMDRCVAAAILSRFCGFKTAEGYIRSFTKMRHLFKKKWRDSWAKNGRVDQATRSNWDSSFTFVDRVSLFTMIVIPNRGICERIINCFQTGWASATFKLVCSTGNSTHAFTTQNSRIQSGRASGECLNSCEQKLKRGAKKLIRER